MKVLLSLLLFGAVLTGCMSVPAGVHVIVTEHPQDYCVQYANCYYAPDRAIVVVPGQSDKLLAHELCHAHQHETILEAGKTASIDLHEWLDTDEGIEYSAVVEAHARPAEWNLSANSVIEDFAEACGRYLTDWSYQDASRNTFFEERGFK